MPNLLIRIVLPIVLAAMTFSQADAKTIHAAQQAGKSTQRASSVKATQKFVPLAAWELAVLSGDAVALKSLYSTVPPAVTVIGKNESYDPAVESKFWASAKAAGLISLKTRIAKLDSPQPGIQRVTFQLEANLHPASGEQKAFAAIAQYWLQESGKWKIVATQRTPLARLPQPVVLLLPEPNGKVPDVDQIYPSPSEAKADIAAAIAVAARDHKRVLLDFGGNWCSDCHVLDATFHYPEVARLLKPNFEVVHINIGEYDQNLDLAAQYEIPLKRGVPELAVLDAKGNLLVSQKNADFENTSKIGLKDVENFLGRWKPGA